MHEPSDVGAEAGTSPESGVGTIRIGGLSSEGDGVGRLADGRVVFVEGAVPGDDVELADLVLRKRMARARIGRLVRPSADRVEPECPHFGACGGCDWQHVRYAVQLEAKRARVRDALVRIGGFELDDALEIVPSPDPYRYRARARPVERDGRLGYRRRGSREIVPVEACPVLRPELEEALRSLGREIADGGVDGKGGARARAGEREWILSAGTDGEVVRHGATRRARQGTGPAIALEVLGESLRAGAQSFVQGNALLWDRLAGLVHAELIEGLGDPKALRFLELYAGIGFFTLPLARSGLSGVAIESDRSAFADLRANLDRADLAARVETIRARVERRSDLATRCADADVLLADPPRAGLASPVREAIAASGPGRVVYVSCDPATLARDLAGLRQAGYRLASVRALDLFPQTPHVEVVARLARDRAASRE